MPHVKVSIDDQVLMDAAVGQFSTSPPRGVEELTRRAGAGSEPWYPAILAAMSHAIMTDTDTEIVVQTRAKGWLMDVGEAD